MARSLTSEVQHEIKTEFLRLKSIKLVARKTGASRNAIRRLLRSEGLVSVRPSEEPQRHDKIEPRRPDERLKAISFSQLEKLFERGRHPAENLDFERHIKGLAESLASEFGIEGSTVDVMKLEFAIFQWIAFRRFYLMSVEASDKNYAGPFNKAHDKLARTTLRWVDCYQRASDSFLKIVRDLEVKYKKRIDYGSNNIFVGGSAVKIETK